MIQRAEQYNDKIISLIENIEKNLNDVAGLRIICSYIDDIYMLADCLLRQDDVTLIQKKDYIANPKPNGYRSLHLIIEIPVFLAEEKKMVRVEVQLRTIAMDFWASLEHTIKYKKDVENADEIMYELKKCADLISETDLKMQSINNRINGCVNQ